MPHVELKCSSDLSVETVKLFEDIEKLINQIDPSSGVCKSRAYPCLDFLHTHLLVSLKMLPKPHRDEAFTRNLTTQLIQLIKEYVNQPCYFSFELIYADAFYVTQEWN